MKYKIGDKVKIKRSHLWDKNVLIAFDKLLDKIVTIKGIDIHNQYYYMKEINWGWREWEIECLITRSPEKEEDKPIKGRYEILDLRRN